MNSLFGMSEAAEKVWQLKNHQHYFPDQHQLIWLAERNDKLIDDQEPFAQECKAQNLAWPSILTGWASPNCYFPTSQVRPNVPTHFLASICFVEWAAKGNESLSHHSRHISKSHRAALQISGHGSHVMPSSLQQHGLNFMRDSPSCVFPCTKQKRNMCLFHACHQRSVAIHPSGSSRNIFFIPCTNGSGH